MSKSLVAYFSASGTTKLVAERLAKVADADLYEIVPAEPYSSADLDWMNPKSRSTVEMKDHPGFRPAIAGALPQTDSYDTIYIGFPIWWYIAPTIINTFLEGTTTAGKKIALFATSGGSGMGETLNHLKPSAPQANWIGEKRFSSSATELELKAWVQSLE